MPSMGLIGHQWRKHGSCSGLSQKAYLDTTRAAFERKSVDAWAIFTNLPLDEARMRQELAEGKDVT